MPGEGGKTPRAGGKAIPAHFKDPIGLAKRVWSHGGKHGRRSLLYAGLALGVGPLDLLLSIGERRTYSITGDPFRPILIVCGPPRSGTTLMAEALALVSDSAYVTNQMAMFPRSPIMASKLLRSMPRRKHISLTSHYGRTAGRSSPNDGLPLWDRWLGPDRLNPSSAVLSESGDQLRSFFGALQEWSERPVVTKNNAVNAVAEAVATELPTAHIVCMRRDPVYLAQSLLIARRYIHDDPSAPYGLRPPGPGLEDPVEDVIRQVTFHEGLAARASGALGEERLSQVSYEDLCANPRDVVGRLIGRHFEEVADLDLLPAHFPTSNRPRLDQITLDRFREALA